ncbi:MAG TPA: hypothetical protein VK358_17595 [Longimicrobium sp.]|nr:hypothetical protein [Longimicrobium sp.]
MTNGAEGARRWVRRGLWVALALLAGCINTFRTGPVPGTDAQQQIEIPIGETRLLDEERLAVSFARLMEDSRCPSGAQCVTAGNAVVGLILHERGEATRPVRLNTHAQPRTVSHEGYVITVVDVRPFPTAAGAPDEESYVVRLHIVRG